MDMMNMDRLNVVHTSANRNPTLGLLLTVSSASILITLVGRGVQSVPVITHYLALKLRNISIIWYLLVLVGIASILSYFS